MDTDEQHVPAVVIHPPETTRTEVQRILEGTRPWVMLLSVVGFCVAGLLVLLGVAAGGVGLATQQPVAAIFLFLYPLFGLLYVFPSLYLFRYASRIRDFVASGHEQHLENALMAQRSFWKFVGVWTLVGIALAILGVIAAVIIAAVAALRSS